MSAVSNIPIETIRRSGGKTEVAQHSKLLPPPFLPIAGVDDQNAISTAKTLNKTRQILGIFAPFPEIVDSCEPVVCGKSRDAQCPKHARSEYSNCGGLERRQLSSAQFAQWKVSIPNIWTAFNREAEHEFNHASADIRQLMDMQMAIDKIGPPASFLYELGVLGGRFRGNIRRSNFAQDSLSHKRAICRQRRRCLSARINHAQRLIRQTEVQPNVHLALIRSQCFEHLPIAIANDGSARHRAQLPQSAKFKNGVVNVIAKPVVVCTNDH
jgi:hypothetical protein